MSVYRWPAKVRATVYDDDAVALGDPDLGVLGAVLDVGQDGDVGVRLIGEVAGLEVGVAGDAADVVVVLDADGPDGEAGVGHGVAGRC